MPTRFLSGALSALLVVGGVGMLLAFSASPAPAYPILWLIAELRGFRQRPQKDFAHFELDRFDAARLETAETGATEAIQRLRDIEAGKIHARENEIDHLIELYRAERTRMSRLREIPIKRLRQWSFARAMISSTRLGFVLIPLITGATVFALSAHGNPLAADPYRVLSAICAIWIPLAFPLLLVIRRRQIEGSLGDRAMFYERWRPNEDFLDFYLSRTDPSAADNSDAEEAEPTPETPHVDETGRSRPARPWHVVLQIEPQATDADIRQAYHLRMKEYHPDKTIGLGSELRDLAEIITREINQAYDEAGRR